MVGLVLAWGSFAGWQVLYHEVFIRDCQFRDNVLCCCYEDIRSNGLRTQNREVQSPHKSQKLIYNIFYFAQFSKLLLVQLTSTVNLFNASAVCTQSTNYF
jgi:hypothetical protein